MSQTKASTVPITIKGLKKQYGQITAVRDLNLVVRESEIYGLLGPNGAGKSTIMNVLIGSIRADEGTVRIFGNDPIADVVDSHRRIGFLPDQYGIYETMTALDHIRYALEARGIDDDPRTPLKRVGLGPVVSEPAGAFSKGMQQRLALAIAIAGSPDLLLLDEPFSGLDPNGVRLFIDIIHECRRNGATVFLSSHDMARVDQICNKIGIIADGSILIEGTTEEVLDQCPLTDVLTVTFQRPVKDDHLRAFTTIDGVFVTGSGRQLTVQLRPPATPTTIEDRLESLEIEIQSIVEHEPSLEDAFVQYTTG